jgi:MOSC domain-containing protein YiiM
MDGRLEDAFVAQAGGEPMERRERLKAVEGGLAGDRYQTGDGHYSRVSTCEVTLVEREALNQIHDAYGIDLSAGQHRRNLVTSGVAVEDLLEATFRIGDAVFRGTKRRPPCAYLDAVADPPGISSALKERGGICADVVEPGEVAVGDELELVEPDPRTVGEEIAARLEAQRQ